MTYILFIIVHPVWGRSQIIRRRESLVLYKSFITLWILVLYERTNLKAVLPQRPLDKGLVRYKKIDFSKLVSLDVSPNFLQKIEILMGRRETRVGKKRQKWIKRSDGDGWLWLVRWEELPFFVLHFLHIMDSPVPRDWKKAPEMEKRSDGDGWLWLVRWEELAFLVLHFLQIMDSPVPRAQLLMRHSYSLGQGERPYLIYNFFLRKDSLFPEVSSLNLQMSKRYRVKNIREYGSYISMDLPFPYLSP